MKIAITGATGKLGSLIVEQLKTKVPATDIVALVRTPAKAARLGVEARAFDYNQPAGLAAALQGVDTLLIVSSNELGQRAAQHAAVIKAAKDAGVKWVLYTSLLRADTSAITILADEHRQTERDLKNSGLAYTILRNGWYTENYTASVPGAVKGGAFLGSAGEGKIASAPRADYAAAAVAVLTSTGHAGKTYELAGDTAYTLTELAAEISRLTGKTIPYKNLPESEYAKVLTGLGLPEAMAGAFANFDTGAAKGALYDDSRELSHLLGRPTTPLSEVVAAALKA
ncbi:MAG: SDR family oxidoreductase [Acidobacteriota bacterium]|nr:SDR family oxidoreductase [Acidobacteriota bacterium]